ncbi:MAG: hypothetical protein JSU63_04715 [Phycisphaerales bacterium]|nr:MAG: hypothetical protein JSU63_04715 [Phycisphaerales bacterium]
MNRLRVKMTVAQVLLLCALLSGIMGCNHDVASKIATLSGAYVGDLVTVLATDYLNDVLRVEDSESTDEHVHEDEHSHEAQPLHDHEH